MFDAASVANRLAGTRFARVRYVEETDSTNDDVVPLLADVSRAGETLVTNFQRAGRGQRGRRWIAPPGSALMFTTILPEPLDPDSLWAVPFWCALAVAQAIERASGVVVRLQWPNDLLLDERKCCGILGVSRVAGDLAYVAIGVGLNVVRPPGGDGLAEIDPPPAFLSDAFATASRETLLAHVLTAFADDERRLASPRSIARAWERRAALAGTPYRLAAPNGDVVHGTAQRLDDDGALVVTADGVERRFAIGDARVVR